MRRFLAFMWIYGIVMFTVHLWLDGPALVQNVEAAGQTYYISFSTGSNSNTGTSEGSPWKSSPYMSTAAGCGGATHSYSAAPGDQFLYKGGDTWPYQCFGMTILNGGTASAQVYFGACVSNADYATAYPNRPTSYNLSPCATGTSWPSSGWTRPIFDMTGHVVGTPYGGQLITVPPDGSVQYVTVDDIEIKNQGILSGSSGGYRNQCAIGFGSQAPSNVGLSTGTIVANVYIHAATITPSTATQPYDTQSGLGYCAGGINGAALVDHVEINGDDSLNGGVTPTTSNWLFFMGGTLESGEVRFSKIHGTINGCDQYGYGLPVSCHDNEFYHVSNAGQDPTNGGIHSHIIYDNDGGDNLSLLVYNNAVHDNNAGLNISVDSQTWVFNNVLWNNLNNAAIYGGCESRGTCPAGDTTYVYNNTMDQTASGVGCLTSIGTVGVVYIYNNICIGGSGLGSIAATTMHVGTNRNMVPPETTTYGFVAANKYSPSSSDPNVANAGTNVPGTLGIPCSGNLMALCQDASGAPWFGGSYKSRPTGSTGWDLGAYQGQGGSTGPPAISISAPSSGTVSGSQNLTASCVAQGTATCTSVQYTIDGFSFGAAQTSSPYTLAWNTATAANASHVIGATATDSNGQTNTASTVTVAVSNSIPGCFISTDNGSGSLSWTANQAIGTQSANFTATVVLTPNTATANQDSVGALSQTVMNAYGQGAALIRFNGGSTDTSGFTGNIDVYKGSTGYAADNLVTYSANTAYTFLITVNFTGANAGKYSVAETSPSSVAIATNYAFRSTASFASLGFINAVSDNTTPDTAKVCNFQVGAGTSLTFSPSSVNLGSVAVGSSASQTITVTSAGGVTTFSSVTGLSGDLTMTNGCTGSQTSCTTAVKCMPSTTGLLSQTLSYTDSATGSPQTVSVSCNRIAATSSATPSPTSVNFGNVQLSKNSTSGPIIVTLMNGPITFDSTPVTFDSPVFTAASNTCVGSVSLPTCQAAVTCTPSSLTTFMGTMTFHDNAPTAGSTQTVALICTGVSLPVSAPAVQFVYSLPIQHTVPLTVNGVAIGTFADNFTCQLTCTPKPGASPPWSCQCN